MKKILISMIGLMVLAGCAYDYYAGGVKYVQDGEDCIYYSGEYGRRYSSDISSLDADKRIVYRNTRCADLFASDNAGRVTAPARQVLSRATVSSSCDTCCAGCKPVSTRKYVLVPAN